MEDINVKNNNLTFISSYKSFDIEWDKVETVEDIKSVLKSINIQVNINTNEIPKHLEELFKRDFLKEKI